MSRDERRRERGRDDRSLSPDRRHSYSRQPQRDTYFGEAYRDDRGYDGEYERDRARERAGPSRGSNHWNPPSAGVGRGREHYDAARGTEREDGELISPRKEGGRRGSALPTVEQVEALAQALTTVIQRSGRREVARAVVDRLAKFGGGVTEDAQRKVEAAEADMRDGTAALHAAFSTLLWGAFASSGTRGADVGGADVEAIRARVERLEERARASPPRPPASPPPPPPPAPPPAPLDKGKGKAPPEPEPEPAASSSSSESESESDSDSDDEEGEVAAATSGPSKPADRDAKRGRARVLLEEVLSRLEEVETKAENAMQQYQQVADDVTVLDTDITMQMDRVEDLENRLNRKRKRRGSAAEESEAGTRPESTRGSARETAEPQPGQTASQARRGEADMDIDDDESEDGKSEEGEKKTGKAQPPAPASPTIKLILPAAPPKPADSALVDEMATLRRQMADMEKRLNEMQAGAATTAPVAPEAADIDKPNAEGAASVLPEAPPTQHRELSLPPNEAALSPAVTLEALGMVRQTLCDMSKHLSSLQAKVDAFTQVDVQALIQTEREQVRRDVGEMLNGKQVEFVASAEKAIMAKLDDYIARTVPALVGREIRNLASKSPNLSRAKGSQSAPPGASPSPTPQSPTVPLQHRLSVPGATSNDQSALGLVQRIGETITSDSSRAPQQVQQHVQQQVHQQMQQAALQSIHQLAQQQVAAIHQRQQQQALQRRRTSVTSASGNAGGSRSTDSTPEFIGMTLPAHAHGTNTTAQAQALQPVLPVNISPTAILQTLPPTASTSSNAAVMPAVGPSATPVTMPTSRAVLTPAQLAAASITPDSIITSTTLSPDIKLRVIRQFGPAWVERYRQWVVTHLGQARAGNVDHPQLRQHCEQYLRQLLQMGGAQPGPVQQPEGAGPTG